MEVCPIYNCYIQRSTYKVERRKRLTWTKMSSRIPTNLRHGQDECDRGMQVSDRTLRKKQCLYRARPAWWLGYMQSGILQSYNVREERRGSLVSKTGGFYKNNDAVIKTRYMSVAAFLIGSTSIPGHSPRIMSDPPSPPTRMAGTPMAQSVPVNPAQVVAPIPDTSSHALGLEEEGDKSPETSTSSLRRVVEKTVDKFGRTRSLSNRSPSKRIFSLGRSKGKEHGHLGMIQIYLGLAQLVLTSRR